MISLLLASLIAHAADKAPDKTAEKPSDKAAIERDFVFACGLSRMASSLLHTPTFKDNPAELGARVVKSVHASLETNEAKNTLKAASTVSSDEAKQKLWMQAAKDTGLTTWRCPTIGTL